MDCRNNCAFCHALLSLLSFELVKMILKVIRSFDKELLLSSKIYSNDEFESKFKNKKPN
jgi:hypothetical protein